jgi:hypothetical protein
MPARPTRTIRRASSLSWRARDQLRGHVNIACLVNYDWKLGELMTARADAWLNTPKPPMEASGASGMKAALNGVPSMSILKKLETRMKHYPAGTIHLQIVLERHPRKPLFAARLTLRVPSNILRSENLRRT